MLNACRFFFSNLLLLFCQLLHVSVIIQKQEIKRQESDVPDTRQWNIWVSVNAVIRFLLSLEPENERRHVEGLTGKVIAPCWEVGSITLYTSLLCASFPWAALSHLRMAPRGAPKTRRERNKQTLRITGGRGSFLLALDDRSTGHAVTKMILDITADVVCDGFDRCSNGI